MCAWNPRDYLRFERERTLPCRDLVARIELPVPSQIIDLGCGPGNSTAVLAERWPNSKLVGIDSSSDMLHIATGSPLRAEWVLEDIRKWTPPSRYDLVFSNAALQWIPDHEREIPRLFDWVAEGGALAFQISTHTDLWYDVLQKFLKSTPWEAQFRDIEPDFYSYDLAFYYDLLSARSRRVDLWETRYVHILPGPDAIVEWNRGTSLRPILNRLPDAKTQQAFVAEYSEEIARVYPRRPDGKVLFPFLRRFVIAYR